MCRNDREQPFPSRILFDWLNITPFVITGVAAPNLAAGRVGGQAAGQSGGVQRLFQVGEQVVDMLDADRQPDHVFRDAGLDQFGRR
jgi:hypothetical protein